MSRSWSGGDTKAKPKSHGAEFATRVRWYANKKQETTGKSILDVVEVQP